MLGIVTEGRGTRVLDVGDEGRTQLLEDIPGRCPLDAEVAEGLGAAALPQFVEDVVGDVVLGIVLVREQCAAGAIGVLDGRGQGVLRGRVLADEVEPELERWQELIVGTDVARIGISSAGDRPAWVDACGEGGEEVRLACPAVEAQGMVVDDAIAVELLEPIGIGVLGSAEVGQTRGLIVREAWFARGVELVEELVHTPDEPLVLVGLQRVYGVHPTVEQILDERHVLLRVHDVEIVVGRDGAVHELPSIAKGGDPCSTRLGSDLYDPSDPAWAVAGGLGGGGEDTYRGDVVDAQPGDDARGYLLGVSAREGLEAPVVAAEDDAIEHPQRPRLTCDGGRATARSREDDLVLTLALMNGRAVGLGLILVWGRQREHHIELWLGRH